MVNDMFESLRKLHLNKYAKVEDLIYVPLLVLFYAILRKFLNGVLFKPIARTLLRDNNINGINKNRKKNQESLDVLITKFSVEAWKCFIYVFFCGYGFYVVMQTDWFFNPIEYWRGWPNIICPQDLKVYYLIEMGYYVYAQCALLSEPRQKDFYEMIIHHIVTVTLIFSSYYTSCFRIGAAIMLIHDIADPFLEIAKLFFYSHYQRGADLFFAIFAIVFIVSRCYFFPFHLLYSAWFDSSRYVPPSLAMCHIIFNTFLWVILTVDLMWSCMIIKMIKEAIIGGGVQGDVREVIDQKESPNRTENNEKINKFEKLERLEKQTGMNGCTNYRQH